MFDVLYSFSSPEWQIFEIKRKDLSKDAPKSELYHWFKMERSKRRLERLSFVKMEDSATIQRRLFDGHELSFTHSKAILSFSDVVEELEANTEIGADTEALVSKFLN